MSTPESRVSAPIPTAELERRWAAVRSAMDEAAVDVLVIQNDNDYLGGYVKYFTDVPAVCGYPLTVVFPRDETMTLVMHGPRGDHRTLPEEGDGVLRGVGRVLSTPMFASVPASSAEEVALAESALAPYARAAIGLVGSAGMSHAFGERLRGGRLSRARFADATELVDRIKAVKSADEIALIRACAAMQDAAMTAAFEAVAPGRREREIVAEARLVCDRLGSEQGLYLSASGPPGTPLKLDWPHMQNRVLQQGDVFALLIESSGPGGFYTELGRSCVLGAVPETLQDEFRFTLEAQQFTVEMMRPGQSCRAIWERYNEFMREHGRPEEQRLHCHGQGYDLVERPLARWDEALGLERGMSLACHPTYVREGVLSWICDNFLIGLDGTTERLHEFPQAVVVRP